MSICELIIYRGCNLQAVVDDLSLFPPGSYCRSFWSILPLDNLQYEKETLTAKYGVFLHDTDLPSSITVKLLPVSESINICLMHYKSASSR